MEIDGDTVKFTTGRTRYANGGIIGLGPDLTVSNGYDGGFFQPRHDWQSQEEYEEIGEALTPEEQIELADYMIAKWAAFKTRAQEEKP